LIGISQGGHVAPIAAVRDPGIAFVVAVSSAAVTLGEQVAHELEQDFRSGGASESLVRAGLELLRRAHAYVRTTDGWKAYAEQRGALRAVDERIVRGFPSTPDDWYWAWWRRVIDVDPIEAWSRIRVPGLLVYGDEDERDNVPVRRSLARIQSMAGPEAPGSLDTRVFSGAGHGMFETGSRTIRQDFLDFLASWILDHVPPSIPRRVSGGPSRPDVRTGR
jgi:pimeloyl-ACP methyl ester carboxylesterase